MSDTVRSGPTAALYELAETATQTAAQLAGELQREEFSQTSLMRLMAGVEAKAA